MNQNWQEKRMRQLFRELRKQDQQQVPTFASVLEAALANQKQPTSGWRVWPVATAVALFIVIIGAAFFFSQQFSTPPTLDPQGRAHPRVPDLPKDITPTPSLPERYAGVPKRPKPRSSQIRYAGKEPLLLTQHKQLPTKKLQPAMLISKWQSPTDALLKTPGAELFKNIPQVGEPLFEMKNLFPNEKN